MDKCCMNHCRDWSETSGGKYSPSKHAPSCENYKTEKFAKLMYLNLGSFICEVSQIDQYREVDKDGETNHAIQVKDIYLTRDQFDNLQDFQGF